MSNYQTVNLPRELAESIAKLCMFTMLPQDSQQLRAILAKPTGEPAAWFDPVHNDFLTAAGRATTISMGDGDRLARYTVPLYAAPTAAEELDSVRHWRGKHDVAVRELAEARREGGNSEIAYKAAIEKQEEIKGESETWKRRAIEAESKLRTYDPKVLELSQQEVASLLAEPRPSEVVLMKCVLCDQLQADLTERDQRIDQLEQKPRVPQGYALVPQSMLLCKEVIGVINFHCGDTDQEEGGQFGQYTDGRLWVGYVLDDDGNKVHGLHIATDEYQEEGSTTLIEFPEPGAQPEPEQCGACAGCTNGCQVDKDSPAPDFVEASTHGRLNGVLP